MNLSALSIRKPVFAWMLMAALILFGAISFRRLGISQMPDVDFPVVSVSVSLVGAAPEVMETQVVDILEDAVMQIQGIRSVTSSCRQGSASVSVEFDLSRNIDVAVQEIQSRIAQVQKQLPVNLDPVSIRKSNPEDQPILWLALAGDGGTTRAELMAYARNVLFDRFATIPGVGDIALGGYVDPNLRVWLSVPKLLLHHLSADDVINAIKNEHADIPSGRIGNAEKEYNVRLMGEAANPKEFGDIVVNLRGGGANYRPIPLREVARVEEGTADIRRLSRYNGKASIGLGVLKQHGSNAVEVADAVKAKVAEVARELPKGLKLDVRMDQTRFIRSSVSELNFTLLLSAILTSIVCFLFLGSWSSTLNVLLAIPTSIVGTFIALYFLGFTLNTFTLLGLSLAIGIVVDDAIMMLENIVRYREKGVAKKEAALRGSKEIGFAALAATLAIVAIFLPVVFMQGIIGKFLLQYGVTVTIAVLLSLVEALTLTPMRCAQFLEVEQHPNWLQRTSGKVFEKLAVGYASLLKRVLKTPRRILLLGGLGFGASLFLIRFIPGEMVPAQDMGQFLLRVKTPVGSSLEATDSQFLRLEEYLSKVPEVEGYFSSVGGFGGDAVNEGILFVTLKDLSQRTKSQKELMHQIRSDLQQLLPKRTKVVAQDLSMRGFSSSRGYPVEFTVQGPDWERLGQLTQEMVQKLEATGKVVDVNTDYQTGMPEVQILPNRQAAADHSVSIADLAQAIHATVGGVVLGANTRYSKNGHRYDIRVRLEKEERSQAEQIRDLRVRNNRGELVPLAKLVEIQEKPSLQVISRRNRERAITIHGNIAPGSSQQEALKTVEALGKALPSGYHAVLTGSAQSFRETLTSFLVALVLGIFAAYIVLASQFNSFFHPISVLMVMPFSISGALLALWITNQSINIYSLIGLILMLGIVKKNSILLVDFTNQKREEGMGVVEALLAACPVRLRPILMTSFATIAGAIPAALAIGPGAETRIPMAVAIIGGALASVLISLAVVPCTYVLLSRHVRGG